jgi:ELWxxDGT repeat protein
MLQRFSAVLLELSMAAAPAMAAGPYLVADLNTNPAPATAPAASLGNDSAELGRFLYFRADDGLHGHELWRTDGTSEGTELVADICPGPCSSFPTSLTRFGDLIGFAATDGFHGREIWVSDGTREGTRMPRDLCPGTCESILDNSADLTVVGDRLFFVTRSTAGEYRVGLAVTDGTAAGTRTLFEGLQPVRPVGEIQGRLAFIGPGTAWSSALWWSDGTPEGTTLALDLCTSPVCESFWLSPSVLGDRLIFFRYAAGGPQIWVSDGTLEGTRKLGTGGPPSPGDSVVWNGSLYWATADGLWTTNGTPQGTRRLRSFDLETRPRSLLPFGDALLFVAGDPARGMTLWKTRGTPESTVVVSDPAPAEPSPALGPLTRVGDRILFPVVWEGTSEIWETDGTTAGTRRLTRICGNRSPACRPGLLAPDAPVAVGDHYLFGLSEETYGFELWTADTSGPRLVRDIQRNAGSSRLRSTPFPFPGEPPARDVAALGQRFVFSARTTPGGPASLWASDGTAAGTTEIGPGVASPNGLVTIGDRVFLRGSSLPFPHLNGNGLWATDGTAAGTVSLAPGLELFSLPGGGKGLALINAFDIEVGREVWASDGTPGGTGLLKDINTQRVPPLFPGDYLEPGSSDPAFFAPFGPSVLFSADDGLHGREPWITDGTAAGTRLLLDLNPVSAGPGGDANPLSSNPGPFVLSGGRAYFAAADLTSGRELWATDGTPAGTVRARDLRPGPASSNPRDLAAVGSNLFLLADGGASDALWMVTPAGEAQRVRLLGNRRRASSLVAAGNRLFFVVDGPATGPELWTSDGTQRGTHMVREIRQGGLGSYPQELTAINGLLLFAADDGVHGQEPWVSDGTAAGTHLLADLAPGLDASGPANFTLAGSLVGFDADDGVHGREMWAVRTADLRSPGL